MRDDMARAAAKTFFGGNAIFKDLPVGGLFRFPSNAAGTPCRKLNAMGWYMTTTGKFKTGTRTAVIALK